MSKNHQKRSKKSDQISHKELTPPKCLPWEWTMVGKRGQKRALSLRYPPRNWKIMKNSEKSCFAQNRQKVKKWQKSENHKNTKINKMQKVKKSKSDKNRKGEKIIKKSDILKKPQKWPKWQINGQNRHFVISEPPGPAFFGFWGFQGVPRLP